MKQLSLLLILIFLFSSCEKEELKEDKEIFIGKWKWAFTYKLAYTYLPHGGRRQKPSYDTIFSNSENVKSIEFEKDGDVVFSNNGYDVRKRIFFKDFSESSYTYKAHYYVFYPPNNYSTYTSLKINDVRDFRANLDNNEYLTFSGFVKNDTLITMKYFPYETTDDYHIVTEYYSYFIKE